MGNVTAGEEREIVAEKVKENDWQELMLPAGPGQPFVARGRLFQLEKGQIRFYGVAKQLRDEAPHKRWFKFNGSAATVGEEKGASPLPSSVPSEEDVVVDVDLNYDISVVGSAADEEDRVAVAVTLNGVKVEPARPPPPPPLPVADEHEEAQPADVDDARQVEKQTIEPYNEEPPSVAHGGEPLLSDDVDGRQTAEQMKGKPPFEDDVFDNVGEQYDTVMDQWEKGREDDQVFDDEADDDEDEEFHRAVQLSLIDEKEQLRLAVQRSLGADQQQQRLTNHQQQQEHQKKAISSETTQQEISGASLTNVTSASFDAGQMLNFYKPQSSSSSEVDKRTQSSFAEFLPGFSSSTPKLQSASSNLFAQRRKEIRYESQKSCDFSSLGEEELEGTQVSSTATDEDEEGNTDVDDEQSDPPPPTRPRRQEKSRQQQQKNNNSSSSGMEEGEEEDEEATDQLVRRLLIIDVMSRQADEWKLSDEASGFLANVVRFLCRRLLRLAVAAVRLEEKGQQTLKVRHLSAAILQDDQLRLLLQDVIIATTQDVD